MSFWKAPRPLSIVSHFEFPFLDEVEDLLELEDPREVVALELLVDLVVVLGLFVTLSLGASLNVSFDTSLESDFSAFSVFSVCFMDFLHSARPKMKSATNKKVLNFIMHSQPVPAYILAMHAYTQFPILQ